MIERATINHTATQVLAGSQPFTLIGNGVDTSTGTLSANGVTGETNKTATGQDIYTLTETGTATGGNYNQTLRGTDNYLESNSGNTQAQISSGSITGGGTWTRTSSGSGSTLASGNGTNNYTHSTMANELAGIFGQSQTGQTRYQLVQRFEDVSNANSGTTPGHTKFSPVGLPFRDPSHANSDQLGAVLGGVVHANAKSPDHRQADHENNGWKNKLKKQLLEDRLEESEAKAELESQLRRVLRMVAKFDGAEVYSRNLKPLIDAKIAIESGRYVYIPYHTGTEKSSGIILRHVPAKYESDIPTYTPQLYKGKLVSPSHWTLDQVIEHGGDFDAKSFLQRKNTIKDAIAKNTSLGVIHGTVDFIGQVLIDFTPILNTIDKIYNNKSAFEISVAVVEDVSTILLVGLYYKGGLAVSKIIKVGIALDVGAGLIRLGQGVKELSEGKNRDATLHLTEGFLRLVIGGASYKKLREATKKYVDAQQKVAKTELLLNSVATSLDPAHLRTLEFHGFKPVDVLPGTNSKIAIIGRPMGGETIGKAGRPLGVHDYADALRKQGYDVEVYIPPERGELKLLVEQALRKEGKLVTPAAIDAYRLPDDVIRSTTSFKRNMEWAQRMKDEGWTVIDIGNNTKSNSLGAYYEGELKILFADRLK